MTLLKRIELSVRKKINGLFEDTSNVEILTEPHDILASIPNPKILFLRQDKIGDIIISTPVLRAVREKYPNAELHILLSPNNFNSHHITDEYNIKPILYSKGFWNTISLIRTLKSEKYDCIVDLIDNTSTTSSLLMRFSRFKFAVGFLKQNAAVYTHVVPIPDRSIHHIIETIAELVLPFGLDPHTINLTPAYPCNEADDTRSQEIFGADNTEKRLFINISGGSSERYWGTQNFVKVINLIKDNFQDTRIYVGSSPDYTSEARTIVNATGTTLIPPNLSFHEYACLVKHTDILLSPDTSLIHVASAFSTPTIGLFRHYNADRMPWFPYNTLHCSCTVSAEKEFQDIPVEDVFDSFTALHEEVILGNKS